ncbi:MAG: hypothetical protein FWG54_04765 [Bacteroidetes bacterium]|nr:hypothetical protein [Bacteroidota bacterium]
MIVVDRCIELAISRGAILHSTKFDFIDHGKLFVVLGQNEERIVGFFFINSKISPFVFRNHRSFVMQMHIKRSDYPKILHYDSYIGCHELTHIPIDELVKQLMNGGAQIRGRLKEEDLNRILDEVRKSDLFTQSEKDSFFRLEV